MIYHVCKRKTIHLRIETTLPVTGPREQPLSVLGGWLTGTSLGAPCSQLGPARSQPRRCRTAAAVGKAARQELCVASAAEQKLQSFHHSDERLSMHLTCSYMGVGGGVQGATNPIWRWRKYFFKREVVWSLEKEWWPVEKGPKDRILTERRGGHQKNQHVDRKMFRAGRKTEATEPVKYRKHWSPANCAPQEVGPQTDSGVHPGQRRLRKTWLIRCPPLDEDISEHRPTPFAPIPYPLGISLMINYFSRKFSSGNTPHKRPVHLAVLTLALRQESFLLAMQHCEPCLQNSYPQISR